VGVGEVGYIPFDPEAANLMFSLVSDRYERASMIVTSNKPFSGWGEIFGDDMAATAMVDRLIHHAEILSPKATATGYAAKKTPARPAPSRLLTRHLCRSVRSSPMVRVTDQAKSRIPGLFGLPRGSAP
jgi:hypothetical protein